MKPIHPRFVVATFMLFAVCPTPAAAAPSVETWCWPSSKSSRRSPTRRSLHARRSRPRHPSSISSGRVAPACPLRVRPHATIASGFNTISCATGPQSDSTLLDVDFNNFKSKRVHRFVGPTADYYGKVGARAYGQFTGPSSGLIVEGAEASGKFHGTFTITSPSVADGAAGTVRFKFAVAGTLSVYPVSGTAGMGDDGDHVPEGCRSDLGLMRAQVTGGNQQPFISVPTSFGLQSGPGVFGGFTLAAGLVSERRDRHGPASGSCSARPSTSPWASSPT